MPGTFDENGWLKLGFSGSQINMLYDDFLSLVNLLPDDIGDIYVRGPKKNGRNYGVCYFDSLGLTLYVWRGCIRFINVSNYDVFVND